MWVMNLGVTIFFGLFALGHLGWQQTPCATLVLFSPTGWY